MGRPGRPRADYGPVLDDVVNHWARHHGTTFAQAVRAVVTPEYASRRNVSDVRMRRAVRALARGEPLQLRRQIAAINLRVARFAGIVPHIRVTQPMSAEYAERSRRLVALMHAFPELIPEDMPISKLAQLHAAAEAWLRKRTKAGRK